MSKTILFAHGAWVTPLSWESFRARYEERGYRCIAPAWPFDDRPVPELRAQPAPQLAGIGIAEIVEHYAAIVDGLDEAPILVGHSFGGLFVQLLLDRGLGAAGVAISPAPPRGVRAGVTATRASFFVLRTWRAWKKVLTMPFGAFQFGFAHTLPEPEQRRAYDRYVVPTPGRIFYQDLFGRATKIDWHNNDRAPLLLLAGERDRTVEPRMVRSNFRRYLDSRAVTEFKEFPDRTHWMMASPGWVEVADYALEWAERHARAGRAA